MDSTVHPTTVDRDRVTARFSTLKNPVCFVGSTASYTRSCDHILEFTHHEDTLYFVNSGEPHLFLLAPDICQIDVGRYERLISDSETFPKGTNFSILAKGTPCRIRTFERGVHDFTGSCGTGSIAAAQLLVLLGHAHRSEFSFLSEGGVHKVTLDEDFVYLSGRVKKERAYVLTSGTSPDPRHFR